MARLTSSISLETSAILVHYGSHSFFVLLISLQKFSQFLACDLGMVRFAIRNSMRLRKTVLQLNFE